MKKFFAVLLAMALIFAMAAMPAYASGVNNVAEAAVEYFWVIFAGLVCLAVVIIAILAFLRKPRAEQLNTLNEWLLWAVIQAEKEFGAETGAVKLRFVYDLFVTKFPWLAKVLPFTTFSGLVDKALDKMEALLDASPKIAAVVKSE